MAMYWVGTPSGSRVIGIGSTDYVKSGHVYQGAENTAVMVSAQSELSLLSSYPPGTLAYTAGFKNIWQLSAAGAWVDLLED